MSLDNTTRRAIHILNELSDTPQKRKRTARKIVESAFFIRKRRITPRPFTKDDMLNPNADDFDRALDIIRSTPFSLRERTRIARYLAKDRPAPSSAPPQEKQFPEPAECSEQSQDNYCRQVTHFLEYQLNASKAILENIPVVDNPYMLNGQVINATLEGVDVGIRVHFNWLKRPQVLRDYVSAKQFTLLVEYHPTDLKGNPILLPGNIIDADIRFAIDGELYQRFSSTPRNTAVISSYVLMPFEEFIRTVMGMDRTQLNFFADPTHRYRTESYWWHPYSVDVLPVVYHYIGDYFPDDYKTVLRALLANVDVVGQIKPQAAEALQLLLSPEGLVEAQKAEAKKKRRLRRRKRRSDE